MLKGKVFHFVMLSIIFVLFMFVEFLPAAQKKIDWLDKPVTIRFQEEKLSTVLEKISKQTGIVISYDLDMAEKKVTGNYKNVKFSNAVNRLFNSTNKTIQVGGTEKIIVVKTFGTKKFITTGNASAIIGNKTVQRFKEKISDENEIIAGDMTRAELRQQIQQQSDEFDKKLKDENEIIAGDMTRAQLRHQLQLQKDELEKNSKINKL